MISKILFLTTLLCFTSLCVAVSPLSTHNQLSFDLGFDEVTRSFELQLSNPLNNNVHIWNKNTPFDHHELRADMFDIALVSDVARPLPYFGPVYKRALNMPASVEAFSTVPSRGFLGIHVSLERILEDYTFEEAGTYEIRFDTFVHNTVKPIQALFDQTLRTLLQNDLLVAHRYQSNVVRITITEQDVAISRAFRDLIQSNDKSVGAAPGFVGCTSSREQGIEDKANPNAVCAVGKVLPDTDFSNSHYTEWFGTFSNTNSQKVHGNLQRAQALLGGTITPLNYDCSGKGCGFGVFAYVYPNDRTHTIHLCGAYWNASPKIQMQDTQPGTLIHEALHFSDIGGTDDIQYGASGCRKLAQDSPSKAIKNSDSYEYFCESCGCGGTFGACNN